MFRDLCQEIDALSKLDIEVQKERLRIVLSDTSLPEKISTAIELGYVFSRLTYWSSEVQKEAFDMLLSHVKLREKIKSPLDFSSFIFSLHWLSKDIQESCLVKSLSYSEVCKEINDLFLFDMIVKSLNELFSEKIPKDLCSALSARVRGAPYLVGSLFYGAYSSVYDGARASSDELPPFHREKIFYSGMPSSAFYSSEVAFALRARRDEDYTSECSK